MKVSKSFLLLQTPRSKNHKGYLILRSRDAPPSNEVLELFSNLNSFSNSSCSLAVSQSVRNSETRGNVREGQETLLLVHPDKAEWTDEFIEQVRSKLNGVFKTEIDVWVDQGSIGNGKDTSLVLHDFRMDDLLRNLDLPVASDRVFDLADQSSSGVNSAFDPANQDRESGTSIFNEKDDELKPTHGFSKRKKHALTKRFSGLSLFVFLLILLAGSLTGLYLFNSRSNSGDLLEPQDFDSDESFSQDSPIEQWQITWEKFLVAIDVISQSDHPSESKVGTAAEWLARLSKTDLDQLLEIEQNQNRFSEAIAVIKNLDLIHRNHFKREFGKFLQNQGVSLLHNERLRNEFSDL